MRLKIFFLMFALSLIVVVYAQIIIAQHKTINRFISGKVFDALSKEPLAGAFVVIEGTSLGSSTDIYGNYKILNVSKMPSILKVWLAGYPTGIIGPINTLQDTTVDIAIGGYSSEACKESLSVILGKISNDVGESINDAQIFWFPYCGNLNRIDSSSILISNLGTGCFSVLAFRRGFKPRLIEHIRLSGQDTAKIEIHLENESYKPDTLSVPSLPYDTRW
jgi:hypothetical protein